MRIGESGSAGVCKATSTVGLDGVWSFGTYMSRKPVWLRCLQLVNSTFWLRLELRHKLKPDQSNPRATTVSWAENLVLYVCPRSQSFVLYLETAEIRLAKKLHLKEIMLHPDSMFNWHGYRKNTSAQWHGQQCFSFLIYLVLKDGHILDAVLTAYGSSRSIVANCENDEPKRVEEKEVASTG